MTKTAYLSVAEAATELGITRSGVYKLIQRGRLRAIRKTAHRTRISRLALDAYRRRLQESPPVVASFLAAEANLEELRADFARETGMTPHEWERRWKAEEIADTNENMRRTVRALALRVAETEGS
jgi:excisionase family DNA binding protein